MLLKRTFFSASLRNINVTVLVGPGAWLSLCFLSFLFLCFNQLQLTLENNIYPLHKMISALMTMTKKRPSPIVCHLDKHSQWGPCSWRKKNPSNLNRTRCKKKKKYLSKECFMRKLPCLGLAMHFVKKGGISVSVSLSFPPSVSTSSEPGSQVPTICATLSSPEGNLAGGNEWVKCRIGWLYYDYSVYSIYSIYSVLHLEFHFHF